MTLESLFATVLQLSFYGTIGCGVILVCALVNYARAPRWISMTLWGAGRTAADRAVSFFLRGKPVPAGRHIGSLVTDRPHP